THDVAVGAQLREVLALHERLDLAVKVRGDGDVDELRVSLRVGRSRVDPVRRVVGAGRGERGVLGGAPALAGRAGDVVQLCRPWCLGPLDLGGAAGHLRSPDVRDVSRTTWSGRRATWHCVPSHPRPTRARTRRDPPPMGGSLGAGEGCPRGGPWCQVSPRRRPRRRGSGRGAWDGPAGPGGARGGRG